MSFKSKQRAKHGHLFGDDPLSATLVSASDDPLFASTKTHSQSSRTQSPAPMDPLSRNDTSSSTPLSPRRSVKSPSSSIFGDIDVSKLGTSNGKKHTVRSPVLRSKQYDVEDEEDLFGGGHRTRKTSKATLTQENPIIPTHSKNTTASSSSSSSSQSPSLLPVAPSPKTAEPKTAEPKAAEPKAAEPKAAKTAVDQQQTIKKEEEPIAKQEKPTVSSSSSFFRFFKSSNSNQHSKNSSSASSVASVNATSPIVKDNDVTDDSLVAQAPPVVAPRQQQQKQQQQPIIPPQPPARQQPIASQPSRFLKEMMKREEEKKEQQQQEEEEEEEEEEQEEEHRHIPVIEDEATRAFAEDDVMTFKPSIQTYRSISPELAMDALKIDTHKKLVPSISTPTHTNALDDPWSNSLLIQPVVEPSISSPLAVKVQDIEPQKRTAFADLITSWNTGNTNTKEYTANQPDPTEFFDYVAEERRDIGFAGIQDSDDEREDEYSGSSSSHQQRIVGFEDEINPWN